MLIWKLRYRCALAGLCLAGALLLPSLGRAEQKAGMPDLAQEEETCLPTSTSNLIVWFGKHGYPKLIVPGDSDDDNFIHTVHAIIGETNARYDLGTRTEAITGGIAKYIRDAGYSCDVEYRGLDWSMVKFPEIVKDYDADKYKNFNNTKPAAFTQDWLSSNSDPNKGFILLLAFCHFDRVTNSFSYAINAGHAVTLVDAEPDTLLIHDPAHYGSMPGRKVITPDLLTGGVLHLPGYDAPVGGLLLLSGTELEAPEDSIVMLTGAVCVTMHPQNSSGTYVAGTAGAPGSTVGAVSGGTPAPAPSTAPAPTAPASSNQSWATWLFDLLFKK
jgi:hypothetical protein